MAMEMKNIGVEKREELMEEQYKKKSINFHP